MAILIKLDDNPASGLAKQANEQQLSAVHLALSILTEAVREFESETRQ